jgi:secreted trypsin-like serine protease
MKISQFALLASTAFPRASAYKLLRGSQGDAQTRIIGGDEANAGEYPYAVQLWNSTRGHFCGGSMIGRDVVLSAA